MKGLIYKEWCLGKKTFMLFLTISMVFTVLGILVFLSTICGNLKTWPENEPGSIMVLANVFFYVPYAIMLFAVTAVNQGIFMDYSSGWMKYSYTLPEKSSVIMGSKYIYGLIVLAGTFVFGLINAGVISLMSGEPFTVELFRNLVVILVAAICELAVATPLVIFVKNNRMLSAIAAVFVMGAYILFGAVMVELDEKYPGKMEKILESFFNKAMTTIAVWSVLIIVIVLGISYFASVKLYQRREK